MMTRTSAGGTSVGGTSVGGTRVAGTRVAAGGFSVAAGFSAAGTSAAGTSAAGTSAAGFSAAGTSVAGFSAAAGGFSVAAGGFSGAVAAAAALVPAGLTGLANIGNTCYLNSLMQVLSHTTELSTLLDAGAYKARLNQVVDTLLLLEWDKLRQIMWSKNCVVAPVGFVTAVQRVAKFKDRQLFTGQAQNDLQEFLLFIVDCFHTALKREVEMNISGQAQNATDVLAQKCYSMMQRMYSTEYSEMLTIFYGIHVSDITALTTGASLSLTAEPFSVLSLSLPEQMQVPTLYDCLDLYCQKEVLSGPNAWYNSETRAKEDVHRHIAFWSLPTVLIIDLKRWNGSVRKIYKNVSVPLTGLNMAKYVKGYDAATYVYDLYGVCNHTGGPLGGHYTAHVKAGNQKWYIFNDTVVKEILNEQVVTSQAYCLFFRKQRAG